MSRPKLSEGILVAIILSLVVTAIFTVMSAFFPTRWLLQILIAGLSFSYVVYLLIRSTEKVGKLTVVATWGFISILTWMFSPSIIVTLFVHIGLIWLVRALYFYTSLLIALFDLGLTLFAMASAIWTLSYTHSLFLSVWCFFLLQSLFVLLPTDLSKRNTAKKLDRSKERTTTCEKTKKDPFEQAHQAAQTALRQLTAQR